MKGILHLLPVPLGENDPREVLTSVEFDIIASLDCFIVEDIRSARRFLSKAGLKGKIEGLEFYELSEHTSPEVVSDYVKILESGRNVGLLSEAGLPAVADPGALMVAAAHRHDIEVRPYVGPSSLMLTLMSSGLNGQSFAFNGYIPVKPEERKNKIKLLEKLVYTLNQSQIMIETPYRNDALLADLLSVCKGDTMLTIGMDVTLPDQFLKTKSIEAWKRSGIKLGKKPAVFIIGR